MSTTCLCLSKHYHDGKLMFHMSAIHASVCANAVREYMCAHKQAIVTVLY